MNGFYLHSEKVMEKKTKKLPVQNIPTLTIFCYLLPTWKVYETLGNSYATQKSVYRRRKKTPIHFSFRSESVYAL